VIPSDIPTYTTTKQGALLQKLAVNKTVLEVGAFFGFTTVCMAQFAKMVYSIDNHRGDIHLGRTDTLQPFLGYLQKYKVLPKVAILIGTFEEILPRLEYGMFDLAFIDGTHSYEAVKRDIEMVYPLVKKRETERQVGGLIAFHDYEEPASHTVGVTQAVDEFIESGALKPVDREGTLLVCQSQLSFLPTRST
jgi:predicted O-methyltransferase YrrM